MEGFARVIRFAGFQSLQNEKEGRCMCQAFPHPPIRLAIVATSKAVPDGNEFKSNGHFELTWIGMS
jgi:hypothetical protein